MTPVIRSPFDRAQYSVTILDDVGVARTTTVIGRNCCAHRLRAPAARCWPSASLRADLLLLKARRMCSFVAMRTVSDTVCVDILE